MFRVLVNDEQKLAPDVPHDQNIQVRAPSAYVIQDRCAMIESPGETSRPSKKEELVLPYPYVHNWGLGQQATQSLTLITILPKGPL